MLICKRDWIATKLKEKGEKKRLSNSSAQEPEAIILVDRYVVAMKNIFDRSTVAS